MSTKPGSSLVTSTGDICPNRRMEATIAFNSLVLAMRVCAYLGMIWKRSMFLVGMPVVIAEQTRQCL